MKNKTGTSLFLKRSKKYLFSGLAAVLPLALTFYVISLVLEISNSLIGDHINAFLTDRYGVRIPGLGFLLLVLSVFLAGVFVSNFAGERIFKFAENFFSRIPFISGIYPSAKKLSDFLFKADAEGRFKKVVLVEYPAHGSYSIGFLTNHGIDEFNKRAEKELVTVLVPLSPMPHSGLLLVLPKDKLIEVDMDVNDAVKLVLSGGVVVPKNVEEKGE